MTLFRYGLIAFITLQAVILVCCNDQEESAFELKLEKISEVLPPSEKLIINDVDHDGTDELSLVYYDYILILEKSTFKTIDAFRIPESKIRSRFYTSEQDDRTKLFITYKKENSVWIREYELDGTITKESIVIGGADHDGKGGWDGGTGYIHTIELNDDGVTDLVFPVVSMYDLHPRAIVAVDGATAEVLWSFKMGALPYDVVVEDVNNDGNQEILVGTLAPGNGSEENGFDDYHSYLILLNRRGELLWSKEVYERYSSAMSVHTADFDQDGYKDIIHAAINSDVAVDKDDAIYILNGIDGRVKKFLPIYEGIYEPLLTGDVNNDDQMEIIASTKTGKIVIFDGELNVLSENTFEGQKFKLQLVADIDSDGHKEICATTYDNVLAVFDDRAGLLASNESLADIDSPNPAHYYLFNTTNTPPELLLKRDDIYTVKLSKKLTALYLDYQLLLLLVALATSITLAIMIARTRSRLSISDNIAKRLVRSEVPFGIIVLNGRREVRDYNATIDQFIDSFDRFTFSRAKNQHDHLVVSIQNGIEELASSPHRSRKIPSIKVSKNNNTYSIDVTLQKLGKEGGEVDGFLVLMENVSNYHYVKRAVENSAVGQELLHKIKTLISVYKGDLHFLQSSLGEKKSNSEARETVEEMVEVTNTISAIAKDYLTMTTLVEPDLQQVNVNDLIREQAQYFKRRLTEKVSIMLELDSDLPVMLADQEQMNSMLTNLVENAIKAVGKRGTVIVRTEIEKGLGSPGSIDQEVYAVISVQDNGRGIDKDIVDKIFEPGFSRFSGKVGLGLTIVKRIVDNHKGNITVESEVWKGTIFTVRIPCRG